MAILLTSNRAELSFRDAGKEISRFAVYGILLTAANFDASEALWATLVSKIQAITLGELVKEKYANDEDYEYAVPSNGANRETKLLVQYMDSVTTKRFTCTIPTLNPDPSVVLYDSNYNAKDVVLMTSPTPMTEFIAAFEAFVTNPETGNLCTILGLKVVGRNI